MSLASSNRNRIFQLGGYDISKFVVEAQALDSRQAKPEWGGLPEVPRLEFNVINDKGRFSTVSPFSILFGIEIQAMPLTIFRRQGELELIEWDGFLETAVEDFANSQTKLIGMSPWTKALDSPALVTLGVATPAALSQAVFDLYNIPTNASAYALADSQLTGLVTAQVDPNLLDSTVTLMELQKQLASAGYGRIYPVNGEMVYEVFTQAPQTITFDLSERDLMNHPEVTSEENQPSAYKVSYLDGETESAGFVQGGNAQTLDFGPNAIVKVTSLSAAQAIADQWETISKQKTRLIKFGIRHEIGIMLDLTSYITLSWKRAGLNQKPLEIVAIDRTNLDFTVVEGRTIA